MVCCLYDLYFVLTCVCCLLYLYCVFGGVYGGDCTLSVVVCMLYFVGCLDIGICFYCSVVSCYVMFRPVMPCFVSLRACTVVMCCVVLVVVVCCFV